MSLDHANSGDLDDTVAVRLEARGLEIEDDKGIQVRKGSQVRDDWLAALVAETFAGTLGNLLGETKPGTEEKEGRTFTPYGLIEAPKLVKIIES